MPIPILRASERRTAMACPQRWWWSYREGLKPKQERWGALWFGTGVHIALAAWYCGPGLKRGPEPAETWMEFAQGAETYVKVADATDEEVAKWEDAIALGVAMLEGYRALYGRDEHMDIIAPEQTFSLELPWPKGQQIYDVKPNDIMAIHVGTFDLAYRDLRHGWFMLEEHKTARAIMTNHLAMDDQGGTYWAVATRTLRARGLIGPKEVLRGIEYNFMRKALPDDRPKDAEGYYTNKPIKADYLNALHTDGIIAVQGKGLDKLTLPALVEEAARAKLTVLGERSKIQPPPLFLRHTVHRTAPEQATQLRRLQDQALYLQVLRDGTLPITKTTTKECTWCDFNNMCELQERGGDWEDFRDLTYRVEDPYADHRKSTEE